MSISDTTIKKLKDEAGSSGDLDTVDICNAALSGSREARYAIEGLISDALAQREDTRPEDGATVERLG